MKSRLSLEALFVRVGVGQRGMMPNDRSSRMASNLRMFGSLTPEVMVRPSNPRAAPGARSNSLYHFPGVATVAFEETS